MVFLLPRVFASFVFHVLFGCKQRRDSLSELDLFEILMGSTNVSSEDTILVMDSELLVRHSTWQPGVSQADSQLLLEGP